MQGIHLSSTPGSWPWLNKPLKEDGTQEFQSPVVKTVEVLPERMMVLDTDQGVELVEQVDNIKQLVEAYRKGIIKEQY